MVKVKNEWIDKVTYLVCAKDPNTFLLLKSTKWIHTMKSVFSSSIFSVYYLSCGKEEKKKENGGRQNTCMILFNLGMYG